MPKTLVTGAAGFIGFHFSRRLVERSDEVVGLDNLDDYYDVQLKQDRLAQFIGCPGFRFVEADLADRDATGQLFAEERFDTVVHLAAQAGVRHSLTDPDAYVDSNLVGFANVLEGCRRHEVGHLVYASSGSVYGANTKLPFSIHDAVDHPMSLYAATKRANELMAHAYSHLYQLRTTGLRLFTVYGPWGRPDMALYRFTEAILAGKPIDVYAHGQMRRDFTYIDDVVEAMVRIVEMTSAPEPDADRADCNPAVSDAPFAVFNIGNGQPVELSRFVDIIEQCTSKKAERNLLPIQPGDIPEIVANVDDLVAAIGYAPQTPIELGVEKFVDWYREYYGL